MTTSIRFPLLLTLAALSFLLLSFGLLTEHPADSESPHTRPVSFSQEADSASSYLLLEFDGQIGIFVPENPTTPIRLTGIPLSSLPQADREQLAQGISVNGPEELASLLEDFSS